MKVGFLHSILRKEEKYLLDELRSRAGVQVEKIDDREQIFDLHEANFDYDVVIERCVNHSRALHALKILNDCGIPTVNTAEVGEICGSKFLTTRNTVTMAKDSPI